ncbi:MAG TPA: hypothetical protein VI055_12145 [Rubrobacter sp.]|jgi:hypothetical protein
MESLVTALAPVFAAGLAIQQLFELLDPLLERLDKSVKSYVTSIGSLALGFLLAWLGGFQVLGPLGVSVPSVVEIFVTGLIISGGTEGINSLLKFLGYAKEKQKAEAKEEVARVSGQQAAAAIDKMHM